MPSLEDLIVMLSGIHVSDLNRRRAYTVAGHLVAYVLKGRFHQLSERQRQLLVQPSTARLWDNYMHKRRDLEQSPKEAAKQTITDEIAFLEQSLTPK